MKIESEFVILYYKTMAPGNAGKRTSFYKEENYGLCRTGGIVIPAYR